MDRQLQASPPRFMLAIIAQKNLTGVDLQKGSLVVDAQTRTMADWYSEWFVVLTMVLGGIVVVLGALYFLIWSLCLRKRSSLGFLLHKRDPDSENSKKKIKMSLDLRKKQGSAVNIFHDSMMRGKPSPL